MCAHHAIIKNKYGELYKRDICITPAQWLHYVVTYEELLPTNRKCSQMQLAKHLIISRFLYRRAIKYFENGITIPPIGNRDHVLKVLVC